MRILMVNLIDWSKMSGGGQHQMGLFRAWRAAGHHVGMISPCRTDTSAMPADIATALIAMPSLGRFGLPASLDTLAQIPSVIRAARRGRFDVVYTRHNMLTPVLVAACRLAGLRIVTEHNSWLPSQRRVDNGSSVLGWLEGLGQIWGTRWASGSRCVTPGLAGHLAARGVRADRLCAIGNGTDLTNFFPVARAEALAACKLAPERTYVGFIGNIAPWHGLDQALEGFAATCTSFPDTDLLIFGDGRTQSHLKDLARGLGIDDRVRFMGRVAHDRANLAINCFDVALLPLSARNDIGFGFSAIKLRDYAAAGRLVLTGHLLGAIELTAEPWLVTHAPDDGADLGRQLAAMLANRDGWPAAALAARRYAEAHFDWSVIAGEIATFIETRVLDHPMPAGRPVPATV